MGVDTLRVSWKGIAHAEAMVGWLLSEWGPTVRFSQAAYSENRPWHGCMVQDAKLGVIGIRSSKSGNVLVAERSLPKYAYGDNCRLLSWAEMHEAAASWISDVQARFSQWWQLPNYADTAQVKRIDLCYQQPVCSSAEVFPYIHASLNQRRASLYEFLVPGHRGGDDQFELPQLQVHLSGVSCNHNRWEHTRWYDKGIESGNESYLNVVRHEEEFKGGKAGYIATIAGGRLFCNREHARDRMNERYNGWGVGQAYDLGNLYREHGTKGVAAALLVLHPEQEPALKQHLSSATYYRLRALAMEQRRLRVPVDLRLPDDAWQEPMVL